MGAILNMTEWSQLIPGHSNPCNWITWITGRESLSMVSQRVGHDWVTEKQHLLMVMCRVVSCVVGRGYLLWPERSLGKTLLAFALLHYVLQGQICLLFQVSLDFLLFFFLYPAVLNFYFFQTFFLFVVNFVIHWNETAMGLHVFPILIRPPTSLSTRSL